MDVGMPFSAPLTEKSVRMAAASNPAAFILAFAFSVQEFPSRPSLSMYSKMRESRPEL